MRLAAIAGFQAAMTPEAKLGKGGAKGLSLIRDEHTAPESQAQVAPPNANREMDADPPLVDPRRPAARVQLSLVADLTTASNLAVATRRNRHSSRDGHRRPIPIRSGLLPNGRALTGEALWDRRHPHWPLLLPNVYQVPG